MSREHIGHGDIVRFAQERVNLPKEKADNIESRRPDCGRGLNHI